MIRSLLILLAVAALAAAGYYPARFEEGYTFSAKETFLYTAPDQKSTVVAFIPPGEFLEITEFTEVTLESDSCQWGWYSATYRLENTEYSGFVLDRDLAFAHIPLGVDTLFVFRLTGFDTVDNAYDGEVSIIAGGEVIFQETYRPQWTPWSRMFDYDVFVTPGSTHGLTGAEDILFLYFGLEVSGVEGREDLLIWTDDCRLVRGPGIMILDDSDTIKYWTEVILPSTPGGVQEQVMHHFMGEEYNLDTGQWESVEDRTVVYLWTGEGLEEEQTE